MCCIASTKPILSGAFRDLQRAGYLTSGLQIILSQGTAEHSIFVGNMQHVQHICLFAQLARSQQLTQLKCRSLSSTTNPHDVNLRKRMQELWPPKPNELDSATLISYFCFSEPTRMLKSTSSSGSSRFKLGCRKPAQ